ncbi:TatD family hydrolase [Aeromonas dhakensis]|uniref:TatD family hydrolase n=1 Tax=Aeromonas dhakensis TaxID=196024 RepID=UPI00191D2F34|nr:TatD family hydrolase [Aeromonas dhakensis]MBL0676604.1 TatD family hydrolase [Aeromonas dhakensis]MBQ4670382.1 TatD family deoxyribonuclease [Aeromonas dhakensis]MDX7740481.1 TatD family hydrolase [Aeromonas dhakensis]WAF76336.1 TatD family hydrolase [Aeromonas dhakensis]WAG01257.1 TatD family hydrolase [Aeromonas dhakensis]
MQLIDTHCHLDFPVFDSERAALLAECRQLGVGEYIIPAVGEENWGRVMALAAEHDGISYALGVHPWYVGGQTPAVLTRLQQRLAERPRGLVAVGECGLDLRSHVPQEGQLEMFEAQVELAKEHELPLIVHSVRANDTVAKILRRLRPACGGVIHAFSGSLQQAEAFWQLGFRLGIGGVISFERANKTREAVRDMPLEALLLETDAPDMPLQGQQGAPNTPANLPIIAQLLADLRQQPLAHVASVLHESTLRTFQLGKSKINT